MFLTGLNLVDCWLPKVEKIVNENNLFFYVFRKKNSFFLCQFLDSKFFVWENERTKLRIFVTNVPELNTWIKNFDLNNFDFCREMVTSSKVTLSKKILWWSKNMLLIMSSNPKGVSRLSGQNCQGSPILDFYCFFINKTFEICLGGPLFILPTPSSPCDQTVISINGTRKLFFQ